MVVIHEEGAPISTPIKALIIAILIFFVYLEVFLVLVSGPELGLVITTAVTVVLVFVMAGFWNMKFRITDNYVEASFFPFRYMLHYEDIASVKTIQKPFPTKFGSLGLRFWGKRIGFVSRYGEAVLIRRKQGRYREVVMTPAKPKEFVRVLNKQLKPYFGKK
jgi:hypothetical protein